MIDMPQHYLLMWQNLRSGMDPEQASLKAFQDMTGRPKRRRLRKRKGKQ